MLRFTFPLSGTMDAIMLILRRKKKEDPSQKGHIYYVMLKGEVLVQN